MTDPGHRRGRVDQHSVNQHVRAFSAAGHELTYGEGRVVSYAEQPSVTIETADGTRFSWMAHLCELIDPPEPPLAEPGVWGVVEAACVHQDSRVQWVHHPDGLWWPVSPYSAGSGPLTIPGAESLPDDWGSLRDPVLIRPGFALADQEQTS